MKAKARGFHSRQVNYSVTYNCTQNDNEVIVRNLMVRDAIRAALKEL